MKGCLRCESLAIHQFGYARQVGVESQCDVLRAHRIYQQLKRTRFENGRRVGRVSSRWSFYVRLVLSVGRRFCRLARLTLALVSRSRVSPVCLTHKVGLPREISISFGI